MSDANASPFDAKQLAQWRALLEQKMTELKAAQADASGSADTVELDQSKLGRLSRMDALQIQAMARAEALKRQQQGQRITHALARVDAGTYGLCVACEEAIDPRRLAVNPATPLCFDCASNQ